MAATDTLKFKVGELDTQQYEEKLPYKPSDKEKEVVRSVVNLFRICRDERDRTFEYFDGRNLIEYINDSVRRFTTNVDIRDNIEDWQARIHAPFTRNKLLAILGKVVDAMPVAEIMGRGDEDITRAEIVNTLFEYSEDIDNADELMVHAVEEALVKGTVIGYEGVETYTKKIRDVVKYKEGDDITVKENTMTVRKLTSYIIPLENFYPASVGIRRIQDMPYCFVRSEMTYAKFCKDYKNFAQSEYVLPYTQPADEAHDRPFYLDYISTTVQNGNVEVLKIFNQEEDQHVIIANGIWINPIGNEDISPLPFNHKKLPFWSFIYDIYGADFFYGKSLPDRLKSLQDVLNVLQNMMLDQSFLTIFSPILVAGIDDIEDDFLRPGRRITVDTQGLPIDQAYQKLDMGTPNGWHQFILNYTKGILEESSVDQVSQGVAGVGGRTTATEIRNAAAGATSLLGLFSRFIKFGVRDRARLKVPTMLQIYTDPSNPVIQGVLTQEGAQKMSKAFNTFKVDSSSLTPGDRGTKIVDIYANKQDIPTNKKLRITAALDEQFSGKKVVRYAVTPEYLRNFEFDIKLVANPKSETSKDLDRALEIQFQQTMNGLYPDLIDRKEMAARLIYKFGFDPSKILIEKAPAAPGVPGQQQPNSLVPGGGGDNSPNVVKGGTGVGGEGLDMSSLMQG